MHAERQVLGAEGVGVHRRADLGVGVADVLGMREDAVEVSAAEPPSAEGAPVDTLVDGEVGDVLAVTPQISIKRKLENSRKQNFKPTKTFLLHIVPCIGLVHLSDMP